MRRIFSLLTFVFLFLFCSFSFGQKPKSLKECNAYFDKQLESKDITYIKNLTVDQLSELHFTIGLNIRNTWIHGARNPELVNYFHKIGIFHPDDISGIIIKSYWSYLNKKKFDLEGEIKTYKEYWEKAAEREKIYKEHIANSEKKLSNSLIDISYKNANPFLLTLPQNTTGNQIFSDEFIKYGNGYIINSMSTYPGGGQKAGVSYKYHYLDLKTNELFRLKFNGFDTVESVITIDSTIYVSGNRNHQLKIIKYESGKVVPITLTVSDTNIKKLTNESWIKLGVYQNNLFALQTNGLYKFHGNTWHLINQFNLIDYFSKNYKGTKPIIPTENIRLTNKKLYFLQEILQGRDCELFELDLTTNTLSELWKKNLIIDNHKKEINSYFLLGDTLFVAAQRLDRTLLLSQQNDKLKLYVLDDKIKSDLTGSFKIIIRNVVRDKDNLILIADNGMFQLKNSQIIPLVLFENTAQLIPVGKYNIHFNFKPRSIVALENKKYLVGGQFGGLYLVDLKQNSIKSLDDNKSIMTMDLLKD